MAPDPGTTPDECPVFIVGVPRSGTSVVYRTIQKLPSFRPRQPHLNLTETRIFFDQMSFTRPDSIQTAQPPYHLLKEYLYGREDGYHSFLREIAPHTRQLAHGPHIQWRVPYHRFYRIKAYIRSRVTRWSEHPRGPIIKEFFRAALAVRGAGRIVEKTPRHFLHVHQILATFPAARIIWMFRHPLDVFTSNLKRGQIDKTFRHYRRTWRFLNEYRHAYRLYVHMKELYPQSILEVRYENFTVSPREELQRICRFIGEPYDGSAVSLEKKELSPVEGVDPELFGDIVKKTKTWESYIPEKKARYIEKRLKGVMKTLGYFPYTG